MITLVIVGVVSGLITAASPCVLPVLPAILTSSIQDGARSSRRPYVVGGGLVTSFAAFTLLGGDIMALSAANCSRIAAFSVTVEPHGGSPAPTGKVIASIDL